MLIKKEGNCLKKYDVLIDKEELTRLRHEIIINCSCLKHFSGELKEGNLPIDKYNVYKIINYKENFIRQDSNKDFYGSPMINIYKVTYDYYVYPDIIDLIDGALSGENDKILQLLNYEYKEKEDIKSLKEKEIEKLLEEKDIFKNQNQLHILENKLHEYKNTRYGKPVSEYLDKVKHCITISLVDECLYDEYKRFCSFLYLDENKVLNDCNNYQKHLQRN